MADLFLVHLDHIFPVEDDLAGDDFAGRVRDQAEDGEGADGLPAATLPNQPDNLARLDVIRDAGDSLDDPLFCVEVGLQVLEIQFLNQLLFVRMRERPHQLRIVIEMILDGRLVAAGDEQDLLDSVLYQFLHNVLDDWLPGHRKHLFRLRFCRWKQAGSVTGHGHNSTTNHSLEYTPRSLNIH